MNENAWEEYLEELIKDCADREATANLRGARAPGGDSDEQAGITALPTIYRGTQFRSLLEACWAATLDSLNITWEYEPETFDLPSGVKYLPDFHLTEIGTWLEVKGPGIPRIEKAYELGKMLACQCPLLSCACTWPGGEMVIIGHPPKPIDPWTDEAYSHWPSVAKSKLVRRYGGFVRWTSTRHHNSWMTRCSGCARMSWVEGARLLRCPACGVRSESQLYRDFENEFEFVRLPWLSAASVQPDESDAA
ncbi:hypothetical protein [Streptomyces sp. NPDC002758]